MDKDRVTGSAKQAGGSVKEGVGKLTGDKKTENEGLVKKVEGKIENAIGGVKDAIKGKK